MLVFHEQSQVDNDEGDRSGNTRGAMDVDFVLLLVLQLVELLGSLVQVFDISLHVGVVAGDVVHLSNTPFRKPSSYISQIMIPLLMILIRLYIQHRCRIRLRYSVNIFLKIWYTSQKQSGHANLIKVKIWDEITIRLADSSIDDPNSVSICEDVGFPGASKLTFVIFWVHNDKLSVGFTLPNHLFAVHVTLAVNVFELGVLTVFVVNTLFVFAARDVWHLDGDTPWADDVTKLVGHPVVFLSGFFEEEIFYLISRASHDDLEVWLLRWGKQRKGY